MVLENRGGQQRVLIVDAQLLIGAGDGDGPARHIGDANLTQGLGSGFLFEARWFGF